MKLVFAHDHIFKEDREGNLYTGGAFNNSVWKRYLKHFDHLTVTARLDANKIETDNTYNKFDIDNTSFIAVPSLSGPINIIKNKKEVYYSLERELLEADMLIARLPSEIGNASIKIARKLNKPYIIEAVGCVWDSLWNYGSTIAKLYAPLAMYRMKRHIEQSQYVIYVTNKFLQERYPTKGKSVSISNVEIQNVSYEALEKRLKRYKQNERLYTIGMIGSLNNNIKGWDVAFKALHLLKQDGVNFKLKILGDGDANHWKPMLNKLDITNNIEFCGVLPGGNPVLNWLSNIDVYIQPSYQEGLPRAVIEAMSRGCPVIGSNAGGIPELISSDMIHKKGDYSKLAILLKQLILTPSQACSQSKQNIEEAKQYTKKILDDKRKNFIEKFLQETTNK